MRSELSPGAARLRRDGLALLEEFGIVMLEVTAESNRLAELYVAEKIIPERFGYDSSHIAVACINRLDCIISYNFKHINRVKTKLLTGRVNSEHNYGTAVICTAKEVLDDEYQQEYPD
jgi:hypothetical protein